MMETKLFVVVRNDMHPSVKACQAVHAATDLIAQLKPNSTEWGDYGPNLVLLKADGESELRELMDRIPGARAFIEPDMDHSMTALAYYGPRVDAFNGLGLL